MNYTAELSFYKKTLYEDVLPFWEKYAPDEECGGFFTCFSGNGEKMLSTDKYIWSQGRMLYVLGKILSRGEISAERLAFLEKMGDKTAAFLMAHARLENGACTFLTDREGNKKLAGRVYDSSIYVDCFVIIGIATFAAYKKDRAMLAFATELYEHAKARCLSGNFNTDPYPVPKGCSTHGVPMIFTNTSYTLAEAMHALGDAASEALYRDAYTFSCDVLDRFVDENGVLHEMIFEGDRFDFDRLLGRYINPGHTIEDCWFLADACGRFGDAVRMEKILRVLKNALSRGWDEEFSGIRLFVDCEGGDPRGTVDDEKEEMVRKVQADNGAKLWWVHSESLYSCLRFSDDREIAAWYEKIKDYTFKTFPNTENGRGEWIQIRDREGRPENRVVALPVKDPFHIMRNLILLIEECEKRIARSGKNE